MYVVVPMSRVVKEGPDGDVIINVGKVEQWRDLTVDALVSDWDRDIITSSDGVHAAAHEECLEVVSRIPRHVVPVIAHEMYDVERDGIEDTRDLVDFMVRDVVGRVYQEAGGVQ